MRKFQQQQHCVERERGLRLEYELDLDLYLGFDRRGDRLAGGDRDVALAVRRLRVRRPELPEGLHWIASLPASERPKTAAYATSDDPFTQPQIPLAQKIMQAAGIKTVYNKVFPAEVTDYAPIASAVASSNAEAVVLGSVDVPTVSAFVHAFIQQHYNPKSFIATAGPDQGASFVKAVGSGNENGIMYPNGWYPGYANAQSQQMVNEYVAKYGGKPADVGADVAEAYSVGQIVAQAVAATHSLDNAKIIAYLHSGVTLNSVQGPVKFNSLGENGAAAAFVFQWQKGNQVQVLPVGASGSVAPTYPKPNWGSGG
jgi:branched-chain amino acid transport system substrate-binding protein